MSDEKVRDVLMPDLEGADEIKLGAWSKKEGERIDEGETIAEALTDKVNAEIPSPVGGVVAELLVKVGDRLEPGQPIARISAD